ncbi:MAG TPA: DUF4185 domain-containing protein [Terracidiphilus sp.]|nr:DUF4185 domain-containing protein [Terracidiphilus sp.]
MKSTLVRQLLSALILLVALPAWAGGCRPVFPLEHGQKLSWQGADDAYSIPLPNGKDVWIFGDTLYGPERLVVSNAPRMTHSSIGISTCDPKTGWHLTYHIKRDAKGEATSFFVPENPKHWYWAMDGFVARGSLWITLMCIKPAEHPMPWAMNFETCGTDLARIRNPEDDPQRWKISYLHLVDDGVKAYPSATALVEGKYAYIFALYETGSRPLLVTRIPLKGLDNPKAHLEYLAADNTWQPGFEPAKAKEVMHEGTSELSIRFHPELNQWIAVLIDPKFLSEKILLRTAPQLTGPWTEGTVIYHIPEMIAGPQHEKDTFCYAGKEHPELEAKDDLLFTYVCNTMDVPKLMTETNIYFPQVVTLPMPKPLQP